MSEMKHALPPAMVEAAGACEEDLMRLKAIFRRVHKYIVGGTRFHCAARRWCPPGLTINDVPFDKAVRMLRNMKRLLRVGGYKEG